MTWAPIESSVEAVLTEYERPLAALARGDVPAIVLRQAIRGVDCQALIEHLIDRELMFRSNDERVASRAIDAAHVDQWTRQQLNPGDSKRKRIDIGASLGNYGHDPDDFFAKSNEAHRLFDDLFGGRINPIDVLYENLRRLAVGQTVGTAYESGGRRYGPAIIRIHYGGYTYGPHFDSVRLREQRQQFAVYRFQHQFAGVLCLQNVTKAGQTAQAKIHRQFWEPEIDSVLKANQFHDYAQEHGIANATVSLEPGDRYFFNTGLIHEVPGVDGEMPRVVLATFIGYSDDDQEVLVWS